MADARSAASWPGLARAHTSVRSRSENRRSGQEQRHSTGEVSTSRTALPSTHQPRTRVLRRGSGRSDSVPAVVTDVDLHMNDPDPGRGKQLPSGRTGTGNRTCGCRNRSVLSPTTPAAIDDRQLGPCSRTLPRAGAQTRRRLSSSRHANSRALRLPRPAAASVGARVVMPVRGALRVTEGIQVAAHRHRGRTSATTRVGVASRIRLRPRARRCGTSVVAICEQASHGGGESGLVE